MKLAVLGGTFNPFHIGHLTIADEARKRFGYDVILFVPSGRPAHKDVAGGITARQRWDMLQRGIESLPWAWCDDCEIKRQGISRSIDTIRYVQDAYDLEEKPGFILGDDLAAGFSSWKNPRELAREAQLIFFCREGVEESFPFSVSWVPNSPLNLSSSCIRKRIAGKESFRFLVPPGVYHYIKKQALYGLSETGA